ncbi:MAG TPA: SpvB/TcaC N-terminal domain-containing protein, partial [Puia sp.]|nr:SpvB/TcaC N-terminal domain-containing protein [Puia sp.]
MQANLQNKTPGVPVSQPKSDHFESPSISLPKGGGAIKGVNEKFDVNAVNGSASFSIPFPIGSARGFGATLGISYNSGTGNGIFGLGWSLGLPSIRRKTEMELPAYRDATDSDTYIFAGAEDLVPKLKMIAGVWKPQEEDSADGQFRVKQYRPRIEAGFARIERWTELTDGAIHWKVISKDNVTSLFGISPVSKTTCPGDPASTFEWFPDFTYDDKGNCILYEYKPEDHAGMDPTLLHNRNRVNGNASFTNTYLKRIYSGNSDPYIKGNPIPPASTFHLETVLDYGEHDPNNIPFNEIQPWIFRPDAFSNYRPGFELRTCRLCRRVLLYHHFAELPDGTALISMLNFKYDSNGQIGGFTFLKEVTSTGFTKYPDQSYTQNSLPPISLQYQVHDWNKEIKNVSRESLLQAPEGIYEPDYHWVDLYSEGLSGILTERATGLFYKQNLGQGNFSPAMLISPKPSFGGVGKTLHLLELEADGTKYLASYSRPGQGFFRIDDQGEWQPFRYFDNLPNIDFNDPNTKWLDLNGDGRPEILIIDDNIFSWYPSLGEKGFDAARTVWQDFNEEKGPRLILNDQQQSIFLSDMSGDGLTDIVQIMNGSVCYWPNLGFGKFGARVSMDNAPIFDHPDQFNSLFIKLADVDGSGTTDIIYLGKHQCKIWLNQNGNSFISAPEVISPFPEISNLIQVTVIDFLATGTSCIVWNSNQPKDNDNPIRYIDLMNSRKPNLLIGYKNNMGLEVELEYTPSTRFYVQDRQNGTPWVTKLPFPIHCLSKVVSIDRIRKTRLASEYSYHHGYYDHAEREFRGFGRVEQIDAETITHFIQQGTGNMNNVIEHDLHQPPVLIKTWYHTGAFLDQQRIIDQFAHEYAQNTICPENLLPQPVLSDGLSVNEYRQALRACKSRVLRKEIYALDNSPKSDTPYTVEQQNCLIRLLQPQRDNKYASFLVINSETISYQYERDLSDPRTLHKFMLEVDEFANVTKMASLAYKRSTPTFPEQDTIYTTYTENDFTNAIDTVSDYRTPVSFQTKSFEITGLPSPAGAYYALGEIKAACSVAASIDYNVLPDGALQKRLSNWSRSQFRSDNGVSVLPFGSLQSKALLHGKFNATFNPSQLTDLFGSKISFQDLSTLLVDPKRGGYIFVDNYFRTPSATAQYDIVHFCLPVSFTDAFGNTTLIQYDNNYHLFIEETTDALGNTTQVKGFNYRTLMPYLVQDINDNLSAVRFDELGIPVRMFAIGKKGIDPGDEFDETMAEKSANDYPGMETEYHLFEWFDQSTANGFDINNYKPQPNYTTTVTRETHYNADPQHQTKAQESYTYFDGANQELLTKKQATPGEALQLNPDGTTSVINTFPNLRWVGNGRKILNNKGNPVKQYEPYFSVSPGFDDEKEMVELGVTSILHCDPLGRVIRTDAPDQTFSKVEITGWEQKTFDQNDTVRDSQWYIDRGSPDPLQPAPTGVEQRAAWLAAKHYNTPAAAYLDTLGRKFYTEVDNVTEKISSCLELNIRGKELVIADGLDRKVMRYIYDLSDRRIQQISMDAGTRWEIADAGNKPLVSWDERDHEFSSAYDALRRPVCSSVKTGNGTAVITSKFEYGELLGPTLAKANNLLGEAYKTYGQSGILTNINNDFKGNPLGT